MGAGFQQDLANVGRVKHGRSVHREHYQGAGTQLGQLGEQGHQGEHSGGDFNLDELGLGTECNEEY